MAYLHHYYKHHCNTESIRIQQRVKAYQIIRDELYKTSVVGPLLRCLSRDEDKELLVQVHSGVCGCHLGARALIAKVFKQGFYWSSVIDDASKLVTICQACQKFSPNTKSIVSTIVAHHTVVAIAEMGHRHFGAIDNGTRKL
jgi:hypothetical protein